MDTEYKEYYNDEIIIYWRPELCNHSAICYTRLRPVFNPSRRPWIDMSKSTREKIIETINLCPTKALSYKLNSKLMDNNKLKNDNSSCEPCQIVIRPNGPIIVSGDCQIIGLDKKPVKKQKMYSLCRCGSSSLQPFCDGTHFKVGFRG